MPLGKESLFVCFFFFVFVERTRSRNANPVEKSLFLAQLKKHVEMRFHAALVNRLAQPSLQAIPARFPRSLVVAAASALCHKPRQKQEARGIVTV
jgi:hypothetical protein